MTRPRPWTWPALSSLQGGSYWLGSCGVSAVPGGDRGRGAESALLAPSAVTQWRDGRPGTQLGFKATGVCNTDPPPFFCLAAGKEGPVLRGLATHLALKGCSLRPITVRSPEPSVLAGCLSSLAVCLFSMLTGELPREGRSWFPFHLG